MKTNTIMKQDHRKWTFCLLGLIEMVMVVSLGCNHNSRLWQAEGGSITLQTAWGEPLPKGLQVLAYQSILGEGDTWLIFTKQRLTIPASYQASESPCPATAVKSIIQSQKVPEATIGTFKTNSAVMQEWEKADFQYRIRAIQTSQGWISCFEQFMKE